MHYEFLRSLKYFCFLRSFARHVQKHARLLAVLEACDNGKTIRETRDCDIPLVVQHLYYHAGWAQLMDTELAQWKSIGQCSEISMMWITL